MHIAYVRIKLVGMSTPQVQSQICIRFEYACIRGSLQLKTLVSGSYQEKLERQKKVEIANS